MSSKSWSPANSMDRLPVLGGGGGCCCCRRVIPPPLPCLVLSGATSCSLRGCSAGRCRRSAPRSAARTAAALDFGQINFQVWERSGSYGSSSYSPPPPPPPVRRCRGCRRGCPQPRSPIRSPPPPSLPLRTLFPSSGFSPRPPLFFVKVRGVGWGETSLPATPRFPLLSHYKLPGSRAEPPPPRPADSRPSRPVRPPGRRAAPPPRSSSISAASATSCRFPWPSLPASRSAGAGAERGQPAPMAASRR